MFPPMGSTADSNKRTSFRREFTQSVTSRAPTALLTALLLPTVRDAMLSFYHLISDLPSPQPLASSYSENLIHAAQVVCNMSDAYTALSDTILEKPTLLPRATVSFI
jgi:hypothetical protein